MKHINIDELSEKEILELYTTVKDRVQPILDAKAIQEEEQKLQKDRDVAKRREEKLNKVFHEYRTKILQLKNEYEKLPKEYVFTVKIKFDDVKLDVSSNDLICDHIDYNYKILIDGIGRGKSLVAENINEILDSICLEGKTALFPDRMKLLNQAEKMQNELESKATTIYREKDGYVQKNNIKMIKGAIEKFLNEKHSITT